MIESSDIKHLAKLSRLRFSDEEISKFTHDLDKIFNYASNLQTIDTADIEPSSHAIPLQNVFKDDVVKPFPHIEKILANGPDIEDHAFKVPKILID